MRFQPLLESAPGEFVGRSVEEAVQRARSELGPEVTVRCWKTRRGGVLGFFAREVFIAGVKEPVGTSEASRESEEATSATRRAEDSATRSTLDELADSTFDEVSIVARDVAAEDRAFRDVLAQAEAALNDVVIDGSEWCADEVASAGPPAAPCNELEAFRESLGSLGLPVAFRPFDDESALDGLVRSLALLPTPPALPTSSGSVIAVVGSRRDALAVARELARSIGLDETDIIVSSDDPVVRRRIARRKRSTRVSVIVLEAPVRGRSFDVARRDLDRLDPDYVLGAVAATLKCVDVDRWQRELGVEALALRRWDETQTPGELLAALPVYSVDGAVMTTMRWFSLLVSTFVDRSDAPA